MKFFNFLRNAELNMLVAAMGCVTVIGAGIGFFINLAAGILACGICLAFCGIIIVFVQVRYRAISRLSLDLDRVLHSHYQLPPNDHDEGELSILRSEIYKMTVMLREQAEALKKDKTYLADSMSDISHQLKTPLTSMNLIVSMLQKSDLSEERRRELVHELHSLLKRMEWLVASLLKISKLDAGTAIFQRETVFVPELLQAAYEPLLIPIELREQTLEISCGKEVCFTGDLAWTTEAIGNILKNCMEHTPVGGKIQVVGKSNTIYTSLEIRDNGPGMDPEDLPHIFERFYVGKHASESSVGIGLALARMILTLQNGTIKAENLPQGGSRFLIKFYKTTV